VLSLGSFKNKEHRATTELAQTQMHKTSTNNIPSTALGIPNAISLLFDIRCHHAEAAAELQPNYLLDFLVSSNINNHFTTILT